jgi:uncharacterized membrane protein
MTDHQTDPEELTRIVRDLLQRVWRLERAIGLESADDVRPEFSQQISDRKIVAPQAPRIPDLESRIGSQWLNRIGIIAVLFGVAFFLKYAFESELIGPAARVSIGLIAGIGIVIWSEWFRSRGYRVFSFSLKALGLGLLYLSLWAAFQVYSLIPWQLALAGMVTVTVSTTILALRQDAEVLALFALVGGFLTPLLLYTRQNREVEVFAYLLLLDVATLILTVTRAWHRLIVVSVFATMILYFTWYEAFYRSSELAITLVFATAFFIIFALAPVLQSSRGHQFNGWTVVLFAATLNAIIYFFQMYLLIGRSHRTATAWGAVALGAAYIGVGESYLSKIGNSAAESLRRLHFVLGISCITLAIAIRFESHWVSIGWFMEAAVLMIIGFRQRSRFVRWQALALIGVAIVKVFLYDIQQLGLGYRIVSFIALGLLLLVVSFVYQRSWVKQFSSKG